MRGSPVLRSILIALALAVAGAGLHRLTAARPDVAPVTSPAISAQPEALVEIPFFLTLSQPPASVELDTGTPIRPTVGGNPISGTLAIDRRNPHVALVVRWPDPPAAGARRFAKLTLEPPGLPTFTHFFDAPGDIDDFLELPFPAAK